MRQRLEFAKLSNDVSLLDLCDAAHSICSGASDDWESELPRMAEALQFAIDNWEDGRPSARAVDDAIKALVIGVLNESREHLKEFSESIHRDEAELPPQVMPKVNGKSFRCECGCNVFSEIQPLKYRCNSCQSMYSGQR